MLIFVSSTYRDLFAERQAVQEALRQCEAQPWGMEFFNSTPEAPRSVCIENLVACDAAVLLVGGRAGSLTPAGEGLTYTGAEIAEAKKLDKPIFPFILLRDGKEPNDEPAGPLHDALDSLRADARGMTPGFFSTVDQLRCAVLTAFAHWNNKGRPGARKTFASTDEYFTQYTSAPGSLRLFDFAQTLVGREQSLASLNSFVSTSDRTVAVLLGRGGIGKTKLLLEFAKRVTDRTVMFLRRYATWHRESDKELPTGPLLIIADDVHLDADLPRLTRCFQDLQAAGSQAKLVLSCRPRGTEPKTAVLIFACKLSTQCSHGRSTL